MELKSLVLNCRRCWCISRVTTVLLWACSTDTHNKRGSKLFRAKLSSCCRPGKKLKLFKKQRLDWPSQPIKQSFSREIVNICIQSVVILFEVDVGL